MAHLKIGDKIQTIEGELITVDDELGEGAEGVVYKVTWRKKAYALKWYWKKPKTEKRKTLYVKKYENFKRNIEKGAPAPTFLWPLALTKIDNYGCVGYIMALRPPEYGELGQFNINRFKFNSPRSVLNAMLNITLSFRLLHKGGFSYQDLNDGNFFFNHKNGDLKICDNDNITANGESLGIKGKTKYMAPEIMAGNYKPDVHSDRFSLAVILFLLMCKAHPLFGKRNNPDINDTECDKQLYMDNPIFIFDEHDKTNRPDDSISKNPNILWPYYPQCLRDLFLKAFDKSVMNKNGTNRQNRVIEKDWVKGIVQALNNLISCPYCSKDVFIDLEKESTRCPECGKKIHRPPVLRLPNYSIPLEYNKKHPRIITQFEFEDLDPRFENIRKEFARVAHPVGHEEIDALVNESERVWTKTNLKGKTGIVQITKPDAPSGAIIKRKGKLDCYKINFGYFKDDCPIE